MSDEFDNGMLISVIIPVYNTEKYLAQCIDSAINQTYKNIQIILVDDGSTDSSSDICDIYASKYSQITVIHKENGGQSSARNVGMDIANGKYLYFLDSDDSIAENAIEQLVAVAEKENSDVVIFEANSFMDFECDSVSKDLLDKFRLKRKKLYNADYGRNQLVALEENGEYFVCTPLHLYKKQYLTDNNIRFTEGIVHEDDLFCSEVYIHNGRIAHCHQSLYLRRLRPNSTMTGTSESSKVFRYESLIKVYYLQYELIKDLKNSDKAKRIIALRGTQSVVYSYNGLSTDNKAKFKKSHKKFMRHALIHYGKYDLQTAKMCSGPFVKFFLRLIHFIITKIK